MLAIQCHVDSTSRHVSKTANIHIRGGSDWYIISRKFGQHLATSHEGSLLAGLKKWYNYSLLSGESFFHTAAQNSEYCPTVVWDNRRSENWQGKVGCTCDRPSVDWCGCSPMVYRSSALGNLVDNLGHKYYGRKFDPRIDFRLLNVLEQRFVANRTRWARDHYYEMRYQRGSLDSHAVALTVLRSTAHHHHVPSHTLFSRGLSWRQAH